MSPEPPEPDARARLAAEQARLVLALRGDPNPAPVFDPSNLAAAAAALAAKRCRSAAVAWPVMKNALGAKFPEQFTRYAADNPIPSEGGPAADGHAFAAWLARRGSLPSEAYPNLLIADVARGAPLALRFQHTPPTAWLGIRLSRKRATWFRLRLPLPARKG